MESLYYVMAILGCDDGQLQCRDARVEQVRYASPAQCQAAMAEVLARSGDLLYPTVAATCRRVGEQMADAKQSNRHGS